MVITEHSMIKIYTGAILSIFDNIQLQRRGVEPYTVPIYLGDKSRLYKHLQKMVEEKTMTIQQVMPAMSLTVGGPARRPQRQTNRMLKKKLVVIDSQNTRMNWNDLAVDIPFSLNIVSKNITELNNIVEYIMSSFKNGLYYIDVNTPLYDEPVSTPVYLETASVEYDNAEDDYLGDRTLETTLDFTVRGIFHNNVTVDSSVITQIAVNMFMDLQFQRIEESYTINAI